MAAAAVNALVLRDIHPVAAPSWWPPAPGWWLLAAALLLATVWVWWWTARRRRRRRSLAALFDSAVAAAAPPALQVAAMSELLRRAARRRDPGADRYQGEHWLRFLDAGLARPQFCAGAGRLLLDGGFQREVDAAAVAALRPLARERYLAWMATTP